MKYRIEIQEQGSDDWLEFTDIPLEEDQAECMCQTLEKNYPKFKARKVSEDAKPITVPRPSMTLTVLVTKYGSDFIAMCKEIRCMWGKGTTAQEAVDDFNKNYANKKAIFPFDYKFNEG